MFIYAFNHEDYTFTNKMPFIYNILFYSYDSSDQNINNAKILRYINGCIWSTYKCTLYCAFKSCSDTRMFT